MGAGQGQYDEGAVAQAFGTVERDMDAERPVGLGEMQDFHVGKDSSLVGSG